MYDLPVDSPTMPVNEGIVHSPKEFSEGMTLELTDAEITQALQVTLPIRRKHSEIFRRKIGHANFTVEEAMKLIDQFEQELLETLAVECHLIATVDASPVFEGQPPIIDFVTCLPDHPSASYGMDHERKEWEVKQAKVQNKDFLGIDKLNE